MNQIQNIPLITTGDFDMNPVELKNFVPAGEDFEVKRIYYIENIKGEKKTGQHCHIVEKELFIIMSGQAIVILDDGSGIQKKTVKANNALWIPNFLWHGFEKLSNDFVLLALSSTNYSSDRSDYIEDHDTFIKEIKKRPKSGQ